MCNIFLLPRYAIYRKLALSNMLVNKASRNVQLRFLLDNLTRALSLCNNSCGDVIFRGFPRAGHFLASQDRNNYEVTITQVGNNKPWTGRTRQSRCYNDRPARSSLDLRDRIISHRRLNVRFYRICQHDRWEECLKCYSFTCTWKKKTANRWKKL